MSALRIVLAPNAFKGTLTAGQAAEAMRRGVEAVLPGAACVLSPIADGGDGSVDTFVAAGFDRVAVRARDAIGIWHEADIAVRGDRAVVEVANSCGLALLGDDHHPLTSSTLGLGDAIRGALDERVSHVTVCLGGSASTDGGAGMLVALGARLVGVDEREVKPCGAHLGHAARLDLDGLDPRLRHTGMDVIADVASPLHGPQGAAFVFAPQKGASAEEVVRLDDALRHWGRVLEAATGRDVNGLPAGGAAGGTGAAMAAVFGAPLHSGAAILDLVDLPRALDTADLVITGEGRLDASTLAGKGCAGVIRMASEAGIPALAVCGGVDLTPEALARLEVVGAWATGDAGPSAADSLTAATGRALRDWQSR